MGFNRTNLVLNPNFDGGATTDWTALSCTISVDATKSHSGTSSMKVVATGSAGGVFYEGTGTIPVTAGLTYTASCWYEQDVSFAVGQIPISIFWFNASGGLISEINSSFVNAPTSGFARAWITGVAPTGATYAWIACAYQAAGSVSGETVWVDDVLFEAVPASDTMARPYFDGDTANTFDARHAWTGTAYASTSTETFHPTGPGPQIAV